MQTRASLRHSCRLLATASFILPSCCVQPVFLISWRGVYGGMGRGDLFYMKHDAGCHSNRAVGPLRGLRHSSQATMPEGGQLHYRKLMLHAMGEGGPRSGNTHCRHETSSWAYIIPSLLRCAEQTLPEEVLVRLQQLEMGSVEREKVALTKREFQCVRDSQHLFIYELHQRLPLLEDSVLTADLHQLLSWFRAAHRAWVRLPTAPSSIYTCHNDNSVDCSPPTETAVSPSFTTMSRFGTSAVLRDVTPGRHQTYEMAPRLAQLTGVVIARIHEELARFSESSSDGGKLKSARLLAREKKARQCFADELQWHCISLTSPFLHVARKE